MSELEKTFAIIKPDAVRAGKATEIMQLIELNGFTIIAKQKMQLTRSRAEEFYGEHKGKEFFPKLVNFMTSGPVWALVLAKPGAILEWRALMGPTNVFKAREEKPKCLRALYGTDGTQNACHGSDSPASAAREIKFFFPSLSLDPVTDPAAAADYITKQLQPALSKALAALAREKPSADKFEAITFIANYLLQNNPNKPKVLMPDEWDPALMGDDEDDEAEFANARAVARSDSPSADAQDAAPAPAPAAAPPAARSESSRMPTPPAARPPSGGVAERPGSGSADAPQRPPSARPTSARPGSARPGSARPGSGSREAVPPPPPAVPEVDSAELEADADGAVQLDDAATKVQAAFRGYQARKEVAVMRAESQAASGMEEGEGGAEEDSGAYHLPEGVSDEAANQAAVLVQAHMRGHLARKQVAGMRAQHAGYDEGEGEEGY